MGLVAKQGQDHGHRLQRQAKYIDGQIGTSQQGLPIARLHLQNLSIGNIGRFSLLQRFEGIALHHAALPQVGVEAEGFVGTCFGRFGLTQCQLTQGQVVMHLRSLWQPVRGLQKTVSRCCPTRLIHGLLRLR